MSDIKIELKDNTLIFEGVLTFDTSLKAFEAARKKLPQKGTVVLDMAGITRSDSSGLAVLTGLMSHAKKHTLTLKIVHIPQKMMDIARVSSLDGILTFDH